MERETEIKVCFQGTAVAGDTGYMLVGNDEVVCFYVDGWGNTGRIYPVCSSSKTFFHETREVKDYPNVTIQSGSDDENEVFTEIYFPEFEGWDVFCVNGGKTMSVCLRKR